MLVASVLTAAALAQAAANPTAPDGAARAAEAAPARKSVFVLDFTAALGADPELASTAGALVVSGFNEMGDFRVTTAADMKAVIGVEEQKQLMGCGDDACFAELAGALGADYIVTGSLARLDQTHVLTSRLLDAEAGRLENQVSGNLPAGRDELPDAMRAVAYSLLRREAPPRAERRWYASPWVWGSALGAVALGVGGYFVLAHGRVGDGALGTVVLDR